MRFKHLLLVALAFTQLFFAQQKKIAAANKMYDNLSYIDAIAVYEKVAEKGYKSAELFQRLGNAYYFNAKFEQAFKWYRELFALNEPIPAEYYYRYAQTLKSTGNYLLANQMLAKFSEMSENDNRAKKFKENVEYLGTIKEISNRYNVEKTNINSEFLDYGTSFYKGYLVFASNRPTKSKLSKKVNKWDNLAFTNLYASEVKTDGTLSEPEEFINEVATKFHETTPCFTADGTTMYFTRNNFNDGKVGKNQEKSVLLKIYKATYNEGKWINIKELPFNSDDYSCAHPVLSPDDKFLYFASDMPGTLGQSDIFRIAVNEDGTYGLPENLGAVINTEGKETFPFITENNELYFSSDGHPGLGGLDIFATKPQEDGTYLKVFNVGAPLNCEMDDFAVYFDVKSKFGFFSSNRNGGAGYDDIYKFVEKIPLPFNNEQVITGNISDLEEEVVLENVKVTILDDQMKEIAQTFTDEHGNYEIKVEPGNKYFIRTETRDHQPQEVSVDVKNEHGKTHQDFELIKRSGKTGVTTGSDLAKILNIKEIYFDLDKFNIRPDAEVELQKILVVLTENPDMKIDVRAHTDSRASKKYNMTLSTNRAKSTVDYLVQNGIDRSRLTSKGYGETQLVNGCSDGVDCTEEEHQLNRRSEFIIVE
ncbi:OmpA family protein [Flavobacterium lacisediminis]|uniref:OmpA family protein n=1 Tax=Flavobacterium lacisediminis TaxID=2989705 RepID=A0ABT3EJP0_9FLAO|nr:OmpA family protein [Flavobacterium lacisediminis]MCW1148621.1 OmpA family protein [Flavobacterium lacisediminis]